MVAKRTDSNQQEIADALRAVGCSVVDTHELGHGFPDLVVGWVAAGGDRHCLLLEVKAPGGRLTKEEERFLADWRGPAAVVWSVDEALQAVGKA